MQKLRKKKLKKIIPKKLVRQEDEYKEEQK